MSLLNIQPEIEWWMRPYLLDFLVEAHLNFGLFPETLFLSINILDRYCSKVKVFKKNYQLAGCGAMLIAAKYDDKNFVPSIDDFVEMCGGLYTKETFAQMERHILQHLAWSIGHPTVDTYLQMYIEDIHFNDGEPNYDPQAEFLARFMSENALYHKVYVDVMPSVLDGTFYTLARHIVGRPLSCYRASLINTNVCFNITAFINLHRYKPSAFLHTKYSTKEYYCVAGVLEKYMAHTYHEHQYITPPVTPTTDCPIFCNYCGCLGTQCTFVQHF